MDVETCTDLWPRKNFIIARNLLGLCHWRNQAEACDGYDDDDEENKEAQACTEDLKDSNSKTPALKKTTKRNLCWEDIFGCKHKENPGIRERSRKSPKKIIQFVLLSRHIRILNLVENLVKHLKNRRTPYQHSLEPRRTLLSLPQVLVSERWSMESVMKPKLLHFTMLSHGRNQKNGLKSSNLKFLLWTETTLGNHAACLMEWR